MRRTLRYAARKGRLQRSLRASTLIVGYGNPLRGDDGAGPRVASALARSRYAGLRVIVAHQLTPEIAVLLAEVQFVIFVDARAASGGVRLRALDSSTSRATFDIHTSDPASLLVLSAMLYGHAPRAWLITLPSSQFSLGAPLSPQTRWALPIARRQIKHLLTRLRGSSRPVSLHRAVGRRRQPSAGSSRTEDRRHRD